MSARTAAELAAPSGSGEPEVADPPIAAAKPPGNARLVLLSLLAVYVIWSSTYLALRFVVEAMPPLMAGGGRFIVAGAMLYAFLLWRGAPHPTAREWMLSVPVGALMLLGGNGFVSLADQHVSSGSAAVMVATMPLFAAGFGVALGERPARREWLGLVLGFAGVVWLSIGSDLRGSPWATLLLVMSPVCWAIGSMIARRVALPKGLMSAATQMVGGGLVSLLVGLAIGESMPGHYEAKAVGALVYLVIFGSIVAFSAYTYLLRNASASLAMSYAYVNPALAVLLGVFAGAETLYPSTIPATGLIVAGVALLVTTRTRRT